VNSYDSLSYVMKYFWILLPNTMRMVRRKGTLVFPRVFCKLPSCFKSLTYFWTCTHNNVFGEDFTSPRVIVRSTRNGWEILILYHVTDSWIHPSSWKVLLEVEFHVIFIIRSTQTYNMTPSIFPQSLISHSDEWIEILLGLSSGSQVEQQCLVCWYK